MIKFFNITDGVKGFPFFGSFHLMWFGLIFCFSILFYKPFSESKRAQKIFPLIPLCLEISRVSIMLYTKQFNLEYIPIHICSWAMYLEAVYSIFPSKKLGLVCFCFFSPAALLALIFPAWTDVPRNSFVAYISFINHAILCIYPIYMVKLKRIVPKIEGIYYAYGFLIILSPVIYYINTKLKTNFWFLSKPVKDTPLYLIYDLSKGNYYIEMLFLIALIILLAWYGLYLLASNSKRNSLSNNEYV